MGPDQLPTLDQVPAVPDVVVVGVAVVAGAAFQSKLEDRLELALDDHAGALLSGGMTELVAAVVEVGTELELRLAVLLALALELIIDEVVFPASWALTVFCHAQTQPVSPPSVEQTSSEAHVRIVPYWPPRQPMYTRFVVTYQLGKVFISDRSGMSTYVADPVLDISNFHIRIPAVSRQAAIQADDVERQSSRVSSWGARLAEGLGSKYVYNHQYQVFRCTRRWQCILTSINGHQARSKPFGSHQGYNAGNSNELHLAVKDVFRKVVWSVRGWQSILTSLDRSTIRTSAKLY